MKEAKNDEKVQTQEAINGECQEPCLFSEEEIQPSSKLQVKSYDEIMDKRLKG